MKKATWTCPCGKPAKEFDLCGSAECEEKYITDTHPEPKEECVVCDPNWKGKQPLPLCEKHEEECLHPEPSREWRDEFYQRFTRCLQGAMLTPIEPNRTQVWAGDEIVEFIENLILSERTALVEELKLELPNALHSYAKWLLENPNAEPLERKAMKDKITINLLTKKK